MTGKRQSAGKKVNTTAEAIVGIQQRLVTTQQTEKTSYVL
jgi:hypothetical protein